MDIERLYAAFLKSDGICTDSRKAGKNKIFWALKGDRFDGNRFAEKALEDGCSFAVVDNKAVVTDDRYFLVEDALVCLQDLAKHHRSLTKTIIIAITGSNGKTTTKELIAVVLKQSFQVLCTRGNLNNHIGVPLTLLSLKNEHQYGIIEMGANHLGEIKALCNIAMPDYGIITNVGKAHIEGFGSFEGVIKAKTELYDHLAKNDGRAFLNKDDKNLEQQVKTRKLEHITYGSAKDNFCRAEDVAASPFLSFNLLLAGDASPLEIKTNLIGEYNISNVLAAATIGWHFKVPAKAIKNAIEAYQPDNNRSQLYKTNNNTIILDCYNANPTSMHLAIDNFLKLDTGQKKLCILGEMLELGEKSTEEHQKVIDRLKADNVNEVLLVGEQFKVVPEQYNYTVCADTEQLKKMLGESRYKGYDILVKGSRSNKLEEVVAFL